MELVFGSLLQKRLIGLRQTVCLKWLDGRKIRFPEDSWCGRQPLCEAFPDLYSIASSKGANAAKIWVREDGGGA